MEKTTQRILELSCEGLSDQDIANTLTTEGLKNNRGHSFTSKSVQMRRLRTKDEAEKPAPDFSEITETCKLLSEIAEASGNMAERPETETKESFSGISEETDKPNHTDDPEFPDTGEIPEKWKQEIKDMIRAELKTFLSSQTVKRSITQDPDLPPMPQEKIEGTKGRPVNPGSRAKIAGTVDSELERRFQEWRESKGISLSRALDAALWHFLGKPKLSFELQDASDAGSDAWSVLHGTAPEDYED